MGTSSILIPLMLSQVLDRSVGALGLLSTLVSLVGVIGSLLWGRLSDAAHRRKPFVLGSFAVVSASFAGIAFATSFNTLLLLNALLNFFWVANASVTVLIVIENRNQALWERRISHLNQIGAFGWLGGLVLGSLALALANRYVDGATAIRGLFGILAAGGSVATLLAVWLIPRTIPRFTQRRFRGLVTALGNFLVGRGRFSPLHLYHRFNPRRLPMLLWGEEGLRTDTKRFLLATLVAFAAIGCFAVPLPLLLSERFGLPSATVFLCYVALQAGVVLAYPLASRRIRQAGNKAVQLGALLIRLVLYTAGALYLSLSSHVPPTSLLVFYFFIIGVSWSYFQLSGVTLVARLTKPEYRGQALGLYTASAGVGTILAGVISGYLAELAGYQATFAAAAALVAIPLVILYRLPAPVSLASAKRVDALSLNRGNRVPATAAPRYQSHALASHKRA